MDEAAQVRTAGRPLLPRRVHIARGDRDQRLPQQGRRLRSLVQGFLADNAYDCGRSQAPGRQDRLHLGRETEINEDVACLVAASRLNMHRKAEFADQRSARRLVAETPAKVLYIKAGQLPARSDSELVAMDHYPNRQAVKLRR